MREEDSEPLHLYASHTAKTEFNNAQYLSRSGDSNLLNETGNI